MKFVVLTIFPELIHAFWENGIIRRAVAGGLIEPQAIDIRDFAKGRHRITDDRPYGGGCGMVMKPEPLAAALQAANIAAPDAAVVLLSPQGRQFDQPMARQLAQAPGLVMICGRYEGIDERICEQFVDLEISIGDFVLTGGELPAMVVMDTLTRLIPGALGNEDSAEMDSFSQNRLDHAHFTRPPEYQGRRVPEVLFSGHHELIARWRRADALMRTIVRRPDLMDKAQLDDEDATLLRRWQEEIGRILDC
jgi:tRNA (guanine37-N1)-methyltransferase